MKRKQSLQVKREIGSREERQKVFQKYCERTTFRRYSRVCRDDVNELRFFHIYFIENRERYFPPMELANGGLKPISPAE